jgi:hypothetical protein
MDTTLTKREMYNNVYVFGVRPVTRRPIIRDFSKRFKLHRTVHVFTNEALQFIYRLEFEINLQES